MRALVATGPGRLEIGVAPPPDITPTQLLVRARVTAVSAGTEKRKLYGAELGPSDVRGPWPIVGGFGYLAAGEVLAVGAEARGFSVGDRVFCGRTWGGHRELLDVEASASLRLPAGMSFLDGACSYWGVPPYRGVLAAGVGLYEDAAVIGLGPLGLCAVQLLRPICRRVVAADPVAARCRHAERLGADLAVDVSSQDLASRLRHVLPHGPHVVVEASGTQRGLEQALEIVQPLGRVATVGSLPLLERFDLFWPIQSKGTRIVPLYRRDADDLVTTRYTADVLDMVASGRLDVHSLVSWVAWWDEGPRAMDLLHSRPDLGVGLAFAWDGRDLDPGKTAAYRRALAAPGGDVDMSDDVRR